MTSGATWAAPGGAGARCCPCSSALRRTSAWRGPTTEPTGRSWFRTCASATRSVSRRYAAQEAGYPYNDDFNGPVQQGVGFYQVTITADGERSSAASEIGRASCRERV